MMQTHEEFDVRRMKREYVRGFLEADEESAVLAQYVDGWSDEEIAILYRTIIAEQTINTAEAMPHDAHDPATTSYLATINGVRLYEYDPDKLVVYYG